MTRRLIFPLAFVLSFSVSNAFGAEAKSPESPLYELPEIVVTAQKREENVQNVPVSISVISSQKIEQAGIKKAGSVARYTPNVFTRDAGNYHQVNIRGVSSFINSINSPVGMYVDDVNLPNVYMQNPALFDVERVEVLKGPQGTLYGRNSEAGVINIVTRQPGNEFHGKIFTELNAYDTAHGYSPGTEMGVSLSGPIVEDKLAIGVSGNWLYTRGFIKNEFDDNKDAQKFNDITGRGIVRWTPTEKLDISFIADVMHGDDGMGYGSVYSGPSKNDKHSINWDADPWRTRRADGQTLRVKYSGDSVSFTSITARSFFKDRNIFDGDVSPTDMMVMDISSKDSLLSQEFRLASAPDTGPFEWLVGTHGFIQKTAIDGIPTIAGGLVVDSRNTDIDINGIAVFGQGTYTLFDRLHLTAGLRYDYTDIYAKQRYRTNNYGFTPLMDSSYSASETNGELLPKFGISFDFTDTFMSYVTASKGYLSGNADFYNPKDASTLLYKPEYTWNYELGVKTSWLDKKLLVNAAVFYIDMEDKQVSNYSGTALTSYVTNAGKAHSYGAELEVQALPVKGLELFAAAGYTKTEVTSWSGQKQTGEVYNYSGNELTYVPEYTYSLGGHYQHDSGVFGRLELLGTGPFYHTPENNIKEDSYEIVNLRLGYTDGNFEVAVFCNNLFNTNYNNIRFDLGNGTMAKFYGAPRQFGTTVSYSF